MYFCVRTALDLPATCPIKDGNGAKMNCSEGLFVCLSYPERTSSFLGEYGYELFSDGEIGSREYELDLFGSLLYPGDYCLRSFVYFSDLLSNGSIDLLFDYSSSSSSSLNRSVSIQLNSSSILGNRWNELRQDFKLNSLPSKVRLLSEEKNTTLL